MNKLFPLALYYKASVYDRLKKTGQTENLNAGVDLFDVDYALSVLKNSRPEEIENFSEKVHKELNKFMRREVKAYRVFTKNFGESQLADKQNYLSIYSLRELMPTSNALQNAKIISVSSGSSGKPFFWPREQYLEIETTIIHELILKDIFEVDKYSTLVVNAYSMGMYVAGVFTNNAITRITMRGYDLSIISPGISMDDVIRIIYELSSNYQQIIIAGYPPFIKDIVERGKEFGINWKNNKLRFIFGAEAISEEWREYLYKKAGITDYYNSSINTYGSADLAVLGHETPLTILMRKLACGKSKIIDTLFNGRSIVSFVQYHPTFKYFETFDGELVCSGMGGIPLYMYNLHDEGQVYGFDEIIEIFYSEGVDVLKEAKRLNISVWRLPFIVLFGKSDYTVTLYGLNIYPQSIRKALDSNELSKFVSGRSIMETKYDNKQVQYIQITVELNSKIAASKELKEKILRKVVKILKNDNYEYKTLYEKIGTRAKPYLKLVKYGEIAKNRGIKQQWVKKK